MVRYVKQTQTDTVCLLQQGHIAAARSNVTSPPSYAAATYPAPATAAYPPPVVVAAATPVAALELTKGSACQVGTVLLCTEHKRFLPQ